MTRLLGAVAIVWGLFEPMAPAQVRVVRYDDNRLAGIDQVDVLLTGESNDAGDCAPARTLLQSVALDALRGAGLKATVSEKARSWFYSVVISSTAARVNAHCVTALSTQLVAEVQGIPEADRYAPAGSWGSLLVGSMPLVSITDLVTSPAKEHHSAVGVRLRAQLATIAARIRAASPEHR